MRRPPKHALEQQPQPLEHGRTRGAAHAHAHARPLAVAAQQHALRAKGDVGGAVGDVRLGAAARRVVGP